LSTRAKIIALAAFLVALWAFHEYDKAQAVNEVVKQAEKASKDYKERTERVQKTLDASHRLALKEKDVKITSIERNLRSDIERLRNREVRPNVVTITETRETCTGTGLYREDAEFLTREAARAEKVRIERDYFWQQYENARLELEKLND
jgi:hypothetical protein